LEDVAALRAENEALKAELAALKASATTQLGKL
jgi:cell division protein FtsB